MNNGVYETSAKRVGKGKSQKGKIKWYNVCPKGKEGKMWAKAR